MLNSNGESGHPCRDNVEEMDKFLEKYNFPKLDQEEKQYRILMHIYGIQKDGNDDLICKIAEETQV